MNEWMVALEVLAQAEGQAPGGAAGLLASPLPALLLVMLVFWLIVWRPQAKEQERHKGFLDGLKSGDEVVTAGGLFGKVISVEEKVVTLEIARNTKIRVLRAQVQGSQEKYLSDDATPEVAKKDKASEEKKSKAKKKDNAEEEGSW